MTKMRQKVDVGLPIRQNTPAAHGESSTSSDINLAPVAFSQNQISALVLPLVSDSKKLIWVRADETNLQQDVAAELDKTFDVFPYLTQKQTAALAKRCSLHPGQVKLWFMLQRLRYGISWDNADIPKVRKKVKSSQGTGELQKVRQKNNSLKSEEKEPDRKKARKVWDDLSANEGRAVVGNMGNYDRLWREIKAEQLMLEERGRKVKEQTEDKRNSRKKRERMTVTGKMRKKRRTKKGEEVEVTCDNVTMESTKSKPCRSARTRKQKDCAVSKCAVVPSKALDVNGDVEMETKVEGEAHASLTNPTGAATDLGQLQEVIEVGNNIFADSYSRHRTKTKSQLEMMKRAFLSCQYPDGEDYDHLTKLTGVPRYMLVQWFSDLRYYIKKKKPHWMNQKQHSRALANIQYRQCLINLSRKVQQQPER